jgi:hypothetical protein
VYEAWVNAVTSETISDVPLHKRYLIKNAVKLFPGVREALTRAEQKTIGLRVMERALQDRSLEMKINRAVPLPSRERKNTRGRSPRPDDPPQ